jgi:hypothetical protein
MEENKEPRQRMSKRSFYVDAFVCPLLPKNETKRLDVAGVVRDVDNSVMDLRTNDYLGGRKHKAVGNEGVVEFWPEH